MANVVASMLFLYSTIFLPLVSGLEGEFLLLNSQMCRSHSFCFVYCVTLLRLRVTLNCRVPGTFRLARCLGSRSLSFLITSSSKGGLSVAPSSSFGKNFFPSCYRVRSSGVGVETWKPSWRPTRTPLSARSHPEIIWRSRIKAIAVWSSPPLRGNRRDSDFPKFPARMIVYASPVDRGMRVTRPAVCVELYRFKLFFSNPEKWMNTFWLTTKLYVFHYFRDVLSM